MQQIKVPVSVGELVDKITILRIKSRNIESPEKQKNISKELEALEKCCKEVGIDLQLELVDRLEATNGKLWQIEDDIRECERVKDFGERFIALARAVYVTNDHRFELKSALNQHFGSAYHEEKSYQPYQ